jgi:A/G-specific adenine glycosylase
MSTSPSVQKSKDTGISSIADFSDALLQWNRHDNRRIMPWKHEKDPYRIWLSEIILQQTRVEQGLKYYEKFITAFPDIQTLASASPERIFKLWEGLGYYSRCRNLIHTAKYISDQLQGKFPDDYASLLKLKGVGSYTAAAIASFAFNLPHAVVDGNVFRVLSRIFEIETPVDSTEGKKQFTALAQILLPVEHAGEYNQAIMDFGAMICRPAPLCAKCFFHMYCKAFHRGKQGALPVKQKKLIQKQRWFHFYFITSGDYFLLHQRNEKDIWQHLYDVPLVETNHDVPEDEQLQLFQNEYGFYQYTIKKYVKKEQKLTHQVLRIALWHLELQEKKALPGYSWVPISTLDQFAFPKTLQWFLTEIRK